MAVGNRNLFNTTRSRLLLIHVPDCRGVEAINTLVSNTTCAWAVVGSIPSNKKDNQKSRG